MGTTIVFVYVSILAFVAPFIWLMWWSIDSLGNRPVPARAVSSPRRPTRLAYSAPSPVDAHLPVRRDRVTVYNRTGKVVNTCAGPDADGKCGQPLADGTVRCAGCILAMPHPIRGSLEWEIPEGYRNCLLGSYQAFRQATPEA